MAILGAGPGAPWLLALDSLLARANRASAASGDLTVWCCALLSDWFNGFYMVLYGLIWFIWFYMVLYGFIWFYMVLYGFMWFYVVLCGFMWFYMVLCGFMWFYSTRNFMGTFFPCLFFLFLA